MNMVICIYFVIKKYFNSKYRAIEMTSSTFYSTTHREKLKVRHWMRLV